MHQLRGYSLANFTQVRVAGGIAGRGVAYPSRQLAVGRSSPARRARHAYSRRNRVVLYVQHQRGIVARTTAVAQPGTIREPYVRGFDDFQQETRCKIKPSRWPTLRR